MNQKLRKYYFILVFFGHCLLSSGQLAKFQSLTMADGLSASIVFCIGQDQYGFIWAGTENGLNVYDGIRFRHYFSEEGNDRSISVNNISDMEFTGDSLWLGTLSGLCVVDIKSKESKRIDIGNNIDVRTLFLDNEKQVLWVASLLRIHI